MKPFKQPRIRQGLIEQYQSDMGKDLQVAFILNQEETQKLIRKSARKQWTIDQLMKEIENL